MKLIKSYSTFFESLQQEIQKSQKNEKSWRETTFHVLVNDEGQEIHRPGHINNDGEIVDEEGTVYPIGISDTDEKIFVARMGFDFLMDEERYYDALQLDSEESVPGYEGLDGSLWANVNALLTEDEYASSFGGEYDEEETSEENDEDSGEEIDEESDGEEEEFYESIKLEESQEINKIKDELEKSQERILNKIKFDFQQQGIVVDKKLNINDEIFYLSKVLGEDIIQEFNLKTFLLKIKQLIDLKNKTTKKTIRDEFKAFLNTLTQRGLKKASEDEYFDRAEGESSILPRQHYEDEKFNIQVELKKLEEWVKNTNQKVALVFEGRDAAGKGSTIKRFVEYLNPKNFRVVALGVPTEEEKNNWLPRYEKYLPQPGEIVFFDRSWYNRAVVEPAMGYCTEEQYRDFMAEVLPWEENLINNGYILIKFWFSITQEKQQLRFQIRKDSPLKYWKFSPNDAKVIDKYEVIGDYKNQMLAKTSSVKSPWVIVNSNDKRIGRLNAMRYVLNTIDYAGKDASKTNFYPEVITIIK